MGEQQFSDAELRKLERMNDEQRAEYIAAKADVARLSQAFLLGVNGDPSARRFVLKRMLSVSLRWARARAG